MVVVIAIAIDCDICVNIAMYAEAAVFASAATPAAFVLWRRGRSWYATSIEIAQPVFRRTPGNDGEIRRETEITVNEVGCLGWSDESAVDEAIEKGDLLVDIRLIWQIAGESRDQARCLEKEWNIKMEDDGRRAGRINDDLSGANFGIVAAGIDVGMTLDKPEKGGGVSIMMENLHEPRCAHNSRRHRLGLDVELFAILGLGKEDGAGLEINLIGGSGIIKDGIGAKTGNGLVGKLELGAGCGAGLEVFAIVNIGPFWGR